MFISSFGVKFDEKELLSNLDTLFSRAQWPSVITLLNRSMKYATIKGLIIPMIESNQAPWRILTEYELSRISIKRMSARYTFLLYVRRCIDIIGFISIAYLFTLADPSSTGWVKIMLVSYGIMSFMLYWITSAFSTYLATVTKVRNLLYTHLNYIPPEYLGHDAKSIEELEAWKSEVKNIECDILAGKSPDAASYLAKQRMKSYYEKKVLQEDLPPTSRMDVLMND